MSFLYLVVHRRANLISERYHLHEQIKITTLTLEEMRLLDGKHYGLHDVLFGIRESTDISPLDFRDLDGLLSECPPVFLDLSESLLDAFLIKVISSASQDFNQCIPNLFEGLPLQVLGYICDI